MRNAAQVKDILRQMIAVMENERQALAGLDVDAIMGCSNDKSALCDRLTESANDNPDEETQALLESAKRLNEVNRQIRNLVAANVSSRLDALTGQATTYRPNVARAGYARASAAPAG